LLSDLIAFDGSSSSMPFDDGESLSDNVPPIGVIRLIASKSDVITPVMMFEIWRELVLATLTSVGSISYAQLSLNRINRGLTSWT